ncbi:MAG: HAMP domain-containing histidine kinase [Anaerolineales bacterium]|nr:HAMP domain-containing histidine kinase [Anaerolineales bacterium]
MKNSKQRGEYFRTRVSGLAVVIFSLTVMIWHLFDSLLIKRIFNMIDLFSVLFTLLTAMVGGIILFTAYLKELIAELGLWLDDFGKKVRKANWPLEREMLEIVGDRLVGLYPEGTTWILYTLLPGYMLKDRPKGLRKGRYWRVSSKDSISLEDKIDGYIRDQMTQVPDIDIDQEYELVRDQEGETAVFLASNQGIGVGLAIDVPAESRWRGGEWVKRQKLVFVRKALDQLAQHLASLRMEWNEFQKTIDDEELGMIVRMLSHEIAGTLTLLVGSDDMKESEQKALARTVHLVRQLQEVPSLRTGFFSVEPESTSLLQMVNEVVRGVQNVWKDKEFVVDWGVKDNLEVVGDKNLYSVLQNTVFNALSFAESKVIIEVEPGVRKDHVLVKVTDDGPGVPVDKREWIFEPLVAEGTDYRPRGKGVGLFIARRIAREVSGDVYLGQPEEGKERSNQFVGQLLVANPE